MNRKIQKKLTWLPLFSIIILVFCPSESYASRSGQGSNTHSFSVEDNPYKYSSYYSDSESEMYYLKARYYSSELMRFISLDTYDLSNRYAYCDGNPITQTDPDGHSPVFPLILLGAVNLAGTVASGLELGAGIKEGDLETIITSSLVLAATLGSSFALAKGFNKVAAKQAAKKEMIVEEVARKLNKASKNNPQWMFNIKRSKILETDGRLIQKVTIDLERENSNALDSIKVYVSQKGSELTSIKVSQWIKGNYKKAQSFKGVKEALTYVKTLMQNQAL